MINLFEQFVQMVERQPDHPLVISATETYSYGDFRQWIDALAAQLQAHGVTAGACIGLHYPNSPAYISLTYAIWACGACVVPIPVELSPPEKHQIAQHIYLDAVLSQANLVNDLAALQAGSPTSLADDTVLLPVRSFRAPPPGFVALNPAFVRFSSGTTGTAKGVVLSHETIFERIQAANAGLQIGPADRIVWLLSMAYHFAVSIVAYLTFGATILLSANTFGITIIRLAAQHRATIIYAAPTHYALMTQDRGSQLLPDVRLAIVTTTALPAELAAAFYQRFQRSLNETYGIIEVGLPCINLEHPREKQGSVGRPLPAYELRLDAQGTILLRGPGILDAYYEPWRPREAILAQHDGWFATGDLGEQDAEGYLYIRGRAKEVISVGGMKFFPQEVESVLEAHPTIQAACVFRVPDSRLGDVPHAHLVAVPGTTTLPTAAELHAHCKTHLALHKIPVCFRYVPTLAYTASGKVIRDATQLMEREGTDA